MKIGIACFPTFGGSGIIATELANLLSKRHELHLVSYDKPVRFDEDMDFSFHKVELLSYPLFKRVPCCYTLALVSKLVDITRNHSLDLIHTHYAVPNAVSAYLAQKICNNSVKIVTTLHGTDSYLVGLHPSYKEVTQFSMQQSDELTAVSKYLKTRTMNEFNLSRKIKVIPNFVNPEKFRKEEEAQPYKIICHSSNFRPIKRIPDIVKAFAIINEECVRSGIKCKLVLIGDGPERPKTERLAQTLGVAKNTSFLGNVKNVHDILAKSELFLLPSKDESFGLAALEAMSCQVPVIASRVGGLPELVSHGVDGYLTGVGETEELAKYSLKILKDSRLQEELGKNAREKVLRKYTPEKIVPQYEELYKGLLNN
ncbi:MAG: N-acetyl-alpha-D-glucosaminyl L-malate synthase BshA [Candidatus Bathyarchaeota archaeon]|nr:N-acetyl-alpha-D-glucosaminyl L-malate synthase BshA [Candidatus Bathyarchaeota archaeon]